MTTNLDDGTYTIRMRKGGYTFANQALVVDGVESVTYAGSTVVIGIPTAAEVCRCFEYCMAPDGITPLATVTAIARIVSLPYDSGSELHSGANVTGTYNALTGLLYWDIVQGATVEFNVRELGLLSSKVIPAESSKRISLML